MKHLCYSLFIILLFSCNSKTSKNTVEDFIYSKADVVLTINNTDNFKSNTANNHFIEQLSKTKPYTDITNTLEVLNRFNFNQRLYISLFKNKEDSLDYSFTTKGNDSTFSLDSLELTNTAVKLKNINAQKITTKQHTLYVALQNNILVGSNNKQHLEYLFNHKEKTEGLKKIIATQDKNASFSVYTNNNVLQSPFYNPDLPFKSFSKYLTFDTEVNQNKLVLNGFTKSNDSSSLINVFKNTLPQDNQLAQITPSNSNGFLSITFDQFTTFKSNLNTIYPSDSVAIDQPLFNNIIEFGEIYTNSSNAVVLNSLDIIETNEALLSQKDLIETFRGVSIFKFTKPKLFNQLLKPFVTLDNASNYCIIDQFLIFASNTETLENIIVNYQNQTTLNDRDYYTEIKKGLSSQASVLQVINPFGLEQLVQNNSQSKQKFDFKNYKSSALQFIYDTDFAHFNAIINQSKTSISNNSITEMFNIKLDHDVLNQPQFVKNYRSKQMDIMVQDVSNTLYLISNDGKIIWKKQLHGPILGQIDQLDIYKNGRLQYVFATQNRVYVIDRDGNDVSPFPKKFDDNITQPLAVFDYDNKKKYRLFVIQDNNVLLYDAKAKPVPGFKFNKTEKTINTSPKHIRIGRKDYLVFKTNDKLHILNRRGKTRVKVKIDLNWSDQPVFEYNSNFITSTTDGKIATITEKGNVSVGSLNITDKHTLASTTKTLISQYNNKLNIKHHNLELDFGNYTPAKLFYVNNKIYVSTTDTQTQKVLLFDSNGVLQDHFPVYGTSAIDLDNIDTDNNLEFVTKGESNSVLVYKIN